MRLLNLMLLFPITSVSCAFVLPSIVNAITASVNNLFMIYAIWLQSYEKTREKPNLFELFRVLSKFGVAKVIKIKGNAK